MVELVFGRSVRRTEDDRFIRGKGQYTDDLQPEGVLHSYMLRSPIAHANIRSIDVSAAKEAPGVVAVYTGADVLAAKLNPLIGTYPVPGRNGQHAQKTPIPLIADTRVRFAGDTVAMVVAETLDQAKDAADLIEVDYEELPVVVDMKAAVEPDAPLLWPENKSNVLLDWDFGEEAPVADAFAKAAHITRVSLVNNRVVVNSMEPRAALAFYDPEADRYDITLGSQGVHMVRNTLAGVVFGIPPEKIRVRTLDTGGGFGLKYVVAPEYPLVMWAAKLLGRPVKWIGERSDAFLTDYHGRDHLTDAAMAFDADNRILAVRVDTLAALGAYESQIGSVVPTVAAQGLHSGVYHVPHVYQRVRCVATNTTPTGAYRGAGRPEASYVVERLMDIAARELNLSPVELRRKNFIQAAEIPFTTPRGVAFDSGDFDRVMTDALGAADWDGFPARRAAKAKEGLLSGIGLAYYVERTPGGSDEFATLTVHPDETVTISAGTLNHGQGHESAWAQLVADKLGVPPENVRLLYGDTDLLGNGGGTGGSRSLYVMSGAIQKAGDDVISKGRGAAAEVLQAAANEVQFEAGQFFIPGTGRSVSLFEVAKHASGLVGEGAHQQPLGTLPNGCHICEVEIDPATGVYTIVRYTSRDDFGRILNPMLVAGQVHGGIVQGLGQAMGEHAVYDPETGQLLTGSFMDYWMPRAHVMPKIDFAYHEIPCQTTPLGTKGAGEAGTVGAAQAFVNAIVDALKDSGITHIDMPVTPYKLWQTINGKT